MRKQGVLFVLMQKQPPKIDNAENCDDHIFEIPNQDQKMPIVIAEEMNADAGNISEDRGQQEDHDNNNFEIKLVVVHDAKAAKVEGRDEESPNKLIAASIEDDANQEEIERHNQIEAVD